MFLKRPGEAERNQDATVYVGNLDEKVSETLLYELFLQVAPLKNVNIPKDRITRTHQGYGFVEFKNIRDAEYAENIMVGVRLYSKLIKVKRTSANNPSSNGGLPTGVGNMTDLIGSSKVIDIGANLFVGNLDEMIDEDYLSSTFSRFGKLSKPPMISRESENGKSKGYGFISYTDFESSDRAIAEMNGQFVMDRSLTVNYAFKSIGASRKAKQKERHGDQAERLLAAQAKKNRYTKSQT